MRASQMLSRWRLWCGGLMLVAAAWCRADDTAPKPDASLEIIQYKAPAGWQATDRPGQAVRIFMAPDSDASQQATILILLKPAQDPLDLRATFVAAVKDVVGEDKLLESSEVTVSKTRQGFEAVSQTFVKQSAGQQSVYARLVAAKVQNRLAGIYYLATSKQIYDLHQPDMDDLLRSVSFNVGAPAAAGNATAVNDDQLLVQARERFAKGVAGRRKPHTIVGDFIGVDGKPIPNVDACSVFVWGTTVAAETTHYGLEVDAKGHFEQQVPDGLYQLKATCIVNHAGHRVPVDLVWLDDKRLGVDQASTAGIVRDYCMAVGGLKPGENPQKIESYFGGGFTVNGPPYTLTGGSFSTRHPGAKVRLTLTPQGALIDGSQREPITIDVDVADLNYGARPKRVPLGVYRFTATLIGPDGSKQPMACSRGSDSEYAASVDIFWECSRDHQEDRADPTVELRD